MELKYRALGIALLLIGLSLFSTPPSIHANPIYVADSSVGSVWTNNTNIEMPYADVHIQIDYQGQSVYDIEVVGEYTLATNESEMCALAFAFPSSWTEGLTFYTGNLFNITFDNIPVTTWSLDFENSSWIKPWGSTAWHLISCTPQFVAFNVSFQADVNHILKVETAFRKIKDDHEAFSISYVCGTAVSFKGCTQETITVEVNEIVPLSYTGFSPQINLSVANVSTGRIAVWELVYPAEYTTVYDPINAVYIGLEPFENETIFLTPENTTSTTTNETSDILQSDFLGPIAVSGAIVSVLCIATIVLWKSKKI